MVNDFPHLKTLWLLKRAFHGAALERNVLSLASFVAVTWKDKNGIIGLCRSGKKSDELGIRTYDLLIGNFYLYDWWNENFVVLL